MNNNIIVIKGDNIIDNVKVSFVENCKICKEKKCICTATSCPFQPYDCRILKDFHACMDIYEKTTLIAVQLHLICTYYQVDILSRPQMNANCSAKLILSYFQAWLLFQLHTQQIQGTS